MASPPGTASADGPADQTRRAIRDTPARNVILLIGDGMGDSEITLARDYTVGADGRLTMDGLPLTGAYTTHSVTADGSPTYVTDSAAAASGWATGRKTVNGRVSRTPDTNQPLPTILELAKRAGYGTGSVTTDELTGATPAALVTHVTDRSCKGPADMALCPADTVAAGGAGSIAEQTAASGADILLGGGRGRFEQTVPAGPYTGRTVLDQARGAGYRVVTDARGLAAADARTPVLGLFSDGSAAPEWTGLLAADGGTEPQRCVTANPERPADAPTLAELTTKAVEFLDQRRQGRKRGFFLQVEGAQIDRQSHGADPCGQIGETLGFDRAVAVARAYARTHPDTLVVVTGDHGHAAQILPLDSEPTGRNTTLVTDEGAQLKVSYSTNPSTKVQEHSGTQVRVAAEGPQAYRVLGTTDQTDLFRTMRLALGLGTP
ncbi:alkaline phosphatase [Streptomyces sp. NPDC059010]|uniref:alkaline phosphatase n=1 Tax=Streptomyces sp. NPDC059010 TaxID=3346695 RepID=UPI0036B5C891